MGNEMNCLAAISARKAAHQSTLRIMPNQIHPEDIHTDTFTTSPNETKNGLKDFYQYMTGDADLH